MRGEIPRMYHENASCMKGIYSNEVARSDGALFLLQSGTISTDYDFTGSSPGDALLLKGKEQYND